jgi:membrane-associated protease RseP (regulator of RpoE activity)
MPAGVPTPSGTNRSALLRLLALVAGVVALVVVLHGYDVLIVVLALVAMVMLHEAGHFVTAKLSGMKVTEYFLGFGPRVLSFRRGETEYGIKAIPAGGYVKIIGMTSLEEVDPADEARSYRQASFPRRVLVGSAGSAVHFILAFCLLWGIVAFSGLPSPTAEIGGFSTFANATSPAKAAGLRIGDVVVAVNGVSMPTVNDFINYVRARPDERLSVEVRRGGALRTFTVETGDGRKLLLEHNGVTSPESSPSGPPVGVMGVLLGQSYATENAFFALGRAGKMFGSVTVASFQGIGEIFSLHGLSNFAHSVATAGQHHTTSNTGTASGSSGNTGQLISILGAIQVGAQAAQQSVSELLYILVAVNIFVGIVNLVPMLPLDGGHVAIAVYERIRSRRGRRYHADVAKLMPVAYLFLAFILVLGLGALYANALNPVHLPGG